MRVWDQKKLYFCFICGLFSILLLGPGGNADLKTTTGNLFFDSDSDQQVEMTLNTTGLGIGTSPSTNLHVSGNTVVNDSLIIGGTTSHSNLSLNGSFSLSSTVVTSSNSSWQNYSLVLADTSTDNITLTLPSANLNTGKVYEFKKISNQNQLIITSSDNIDGMPEIIFSNDLAVLGFLKVISYDGNWSILDQQDGTMLNPSEFPGLKAWFISDRGLWQDTSKTTAATVHGDPVRVWEDMSGHGNDATTPGDSNRPLLTSSNVIYGHLTLEFDGSDDNFEVPDIRASTGDKYAYVVSQRKVADGLNWQRLFTSWDGASGDDFLGTGWAVLADHSGGSPIVYGPKITTHSSTGDTLINIKIAKNGVNNNQFLLGNIAEILLFDTLPTAAEDAAILNYLNTRWGL